MRTTKLLNDPAACVEDAIQGICLSNPLVSRIKDLNVVVRSDIDSVKNEQVTLISGGGSGHEPAHAGYIGQGMLAGAVLGNVFASPPVHAILAAIRVCAGSKGVLLIIKNYTGDRLNFGMAMERARAEGIHIEMVVVDDDCALPVGKGITGARGVAGTVFVHKIAGAEAVRSGSTLGSVKTMAEGAISSMVSYGVAMGLCAVPGTFPTDRLAADNVIEVGLGIHAEAGQVREINPNNHSLSSDTVHHMISKMLGSVTEDNNGDAEILPPRLDVQRGEQVAVLLNNLGGLTELELLVVIRDVLVELQRRRLEVIRCYVGSFMTSLEMAGLSLSILKVQPNSQLSLLPALDAETMVNVWRRSPLLGSGIESKDIQYSPDEKDQTPSGGGMCEEACLPILIRVCEALIEASDKLNEYDSVCGDGDCGRVMRAAATHILEKVEKGDFTRATERSSFCYEVAEAISEAMGGTSGAIAEIMLRAMVTYFTSTADAESASWPLAFNHGLTAIRTYGGADVGMRTLLDALVPGVSALMIPSTEVVDLLKNAMTASERGMAETKEMESLAGRANYINHEQMKGVPDPGAYAVFVAFRAAGSYF